MQQLHHHLAALFGLPGGIMTMRLGVRRTYSIAWLAMGLLTLSPLSPNFPILLTLRLLYGLGIAMMVTATGPLLLQWFRPKEVLVMNGLTMATMSLGIFLSLSTAVPIARRHRRWCRNRRSGRARGRRGQRPLAGSVQLFLVSSEPRTFCSQRNHSRRYLSIDSLSQQLGHLPEILQIEHFYQ